MATITASQRKFLDSQEGQLLRQALSNMEKDAAYNTTSSYISNGVKYPGNNISFVDKHMLYLVEHPKMDPRQYLSNLKLMTRIKS